MFEHHIQIFLKMLRNDCNYFREHGQIDSSDIDKSINASNNMGNMTNKTIVERLMVEKSIIDRINRFNQKYPKQRQNSENILNGLLSQLPKIEYIVPPANNNRYSFIHLKFKEWHNNIFKMGQLSRIDWQKYDGYLCGREKQGYFVEGYEPRNYLILVLDKDYQMIENRISKGTDEIEIKMNKKGEVNMFMYLTYIGRPMPIKISSLRPYQHSFKKPTREFLSGSDSFQVQIELPLSMFQEIIKDPGKEKKADLKKNYEAGCIGIPYPFRVKYWRVNCFVYLQLKIEGAPQGYQEKLDRAKRNFLQSYFKDDYVALLQYVEGEIQSYVGLLVNVDIKRAKLRDFLD